MNLEYMMHLEPFVWTARLQSFTAAARRLGVTPTAVSKAVARLEDELGVRLLNRTSRQVALTAEGAIWLEHAERALDALQTGRARLAAGSEPHGPVRLTTSPVLGPLLVGRLGRLLDRHPGLQLSLTLTDSVESLASGAHDVALRVGALEDSSLLARHVFAARWTLVASPAYLARMGRPTDPEALLGHRCLKYLGPDGRATTWPFDVPIPTALEIGDGNTLIQAARDGLGIAMVFERTVTRDLAAGELVRVLEVEAQGPPVHLLCRHADRKLPRVRAVFDHLANVLTTPEG